MFLNRIRLRIEGGNVDGMCVSLSNTRTTFTVVVNFFCFDFSTLLSSLLSCFRQSNLPVEPCYNFSIPLDSRWKVPSNYLFIHFELFSRLP